MTAQVSHRAVAFGTPKVAADVRRASPNASLPCLFFQLGQLRIVVVHLSNARRTRVPLVLRVHVQVIRDKPLTATLKRELNLCVESLL